MHDGKTTSARIDASEIRQFFFRTSAAAIVKRKRPTLSNVDKTVP
jgi:hypothetical protein